MVNSHQMSDEQRALQIWSVLVVAALNQMVLSYEMLEQITGIPAHGAGNYLGHVAFYCKDKGLPILSSLVIAKDKGVPGDTKSDIYVGQDISALQRRCFVYNWLDHGVPKVEEFAASYKAHKAAA